MPKGIYPRSEEHRRNIGLSLLGKNKKPKPKGFSAMSKVTARSWANSKHKKNHLEAMNRPRTKKLLTQNMTHRWRDPKWREKQLKAILKGLNLSPNKPEKFLTKLLQELFPNQWKYTGDGTNKDSIVAGKCPDFINVEQKKIIEFNGNYWHGQERTGRTKKEEEQQRVDLFAQEGYQTLIIWEHELKDINLLEEKIIKFHNM